MGDGLSAAARQGTPQGGLGRNAATLRRTFRPGGRATRSEVLSYLLATLLVSVPVSFVSRLAMPYEAHLLLTNALAVVLALPMPALLARRLHDQGRSGWWALLALPAFAVWLIRTVVSAKWGIDARLAFDSWTWLLDWLVILTNIGCVIMVLQPGSKGPSRYGPDPRESDDRYDQPGQQPLP